MNFADVTNFQELLIRIVILAAALYIVGRTTRLFSIDNFGTAIVGAFIFGILNQFVRPVFQIFTLPFHIITLGITYFLVNGLMLIILSAIYPKIKTKGCLNSALAAIFISIINWLLSVLIYPYH